MSSCQAPPLRPSSQLGWVVFAAGVTSSALVLWLVALLAESGTNIMGWYLYYVFPVGALLVGVLSGSGYAIAARKLNITLSPAFATGMVSIALVDYFAAQYVTYDNLIKSANVDISRYSFLQYFRDACELMTFSEGSSQSDKPIGLFGYFFKALEIGGYVIGAIFPARLAVDSVVGTPDCPVCRQYFIIHRCAYLNASERWEDMAGLTHVDRCICIKQSIAPIIERTEALIASMKGKQLTEVEMALGEFETEALMGNVGTVSLTLRKCPGCNAFHLRATFAGYDAHGEFSSEVIGSVKSETAQPRPDTEQQTQEF